MNKPVLHLKNIQKFYTQGGENISVLQGANLAVAPGEFVAIVGESGSGKSTLLHIAGLLDQANAGDVEINPVTDRDISATSKNSNFIRSRFIGFVYQMHNLLPDFNARENAAMPLLLLGVEYDKALQKADALLEEMQISDKKYSLPGEMSGGQAQRVAIARSIIHSPSIILADEATGNLDNKSAENVFNILKTIAKTKNTAILMATHNMNFAKKMDKIYKIESGKLIQL